MHTHLHRRKSRKRFQRQTPPGASPGVIVPSPEACPTEVRLLGYGPEKVEEFEGATDNDIRTALGRCQVTWVDVTGTRDADRLAKLGAIFQMHSLALEDIVNSHQRSKIEDYGDNLFVVARMAPVGDEEETDQLSIVLGSNYVVTFQNRPGDDLGPVRERIRKGVGKIRAQGPDYLMYALLDAVLDAYFPLLEKYGEELEEIEESTILSPNPNLLSSMYLIRRRLLMLRRAVWPLREVAGALVRDESRRIKPETQVFLRDCYDHTIQIIDLMESYRDLSSGLMDVYLSSLSNRMNEIMKVLTIITTIFIPLSFIAGVYGMNFHTQASPLNMPELKWYYGYPACIGLMILITVIQLIYFRRNGWLGKIHSPKQ